MHISTDTLYLIVRSLFAVSLLVFLFLLMRVTLRELQQPIGSALPIRKSKARAELLSVAGETGSDIPEGLVFDIQGVTTIGRARTARVVLDDVSVSAQHALIRPVDGAWTVEDLGSKNGTLVNGQRIDRPSDLVCGDSLQFGRVRLRLMC